MDAMNAAELRELADAELQERLEQLRREQFGYRMQKATGQLGQPHLLSVARREIARVKTILGERARVAKATKATETSE